MAGKKTGTIFFCQECGYESAKWLGQCPGCRAWNTFVEEPVKVTAKGKRVTTGLREESTHLPISKIDLKEEIQKYHLTMLGILKHIREHRNQYEHCFGKFIDGMEEVCISELDHSAESIQKINKLIDEFQGE